jgi:hypothetical protein
MRAIVPRLREGFQKAGSRLLEQTWRFKSLLSFRIRGALVLWVFAGVSSSVQKVIF